MLSPASGRSSAMTDPGKSTIPSVDSFIAEVLARSPSLRAMKENLSASAEAAKGAGALPDPMIGLMLQDVRFPGWTVGKEEMSMVGIEAAQSLPWPGKTKARTAAAGGEVAIREGELEALANNLIVQVRTVWGRIYAQDQERAALLASREVLRLLAASTTARYSSGQGDQEAVIKAGLAQTRLEERLTDLRAERIGLVASLNALRDRPAADTLGEIRELPSIVPPTDSRLPESTSVAPEVAVRRAAVRAAELRASAARSELWPNLSTGAAYGWRKQRTPVVTLRLGLEIPLWQGSKQRRMIKSAEHEAEMARAEMRGSEADARAEAASLTADWDRAEAQVRRYQNAILPQSRAAFEAARASYLTGGGDFSAVIDDFLIWLDAQAALAERQSDRYATWAKLDALLSPRIDVGPQGDSR
jgi:outer membrane protein, heavy metal efflux system